MPDSEGLYRAAFLLVFLLNLVVSAYHRTRARHRETIPRSAEARDIKLARIAVALPGLATMLAYLLAPGWIVWAQMDLPPTVRWLGAVLGVGTVPLMFWVFRSLGSNVSETVLTKDSHELVENGPYRWVRHPLYTVSFLWIASWALLSANTLFFAQLAINIVLFRTLIVPREEANLVDKFGDSYRVYQRATGRLLPRF